MPVANMPVPTTKPAYYLRFEARPLLWLQAERYGQCKNDYFSIVNGKFGFSLTKSIL